MLFSRLNMSMASESLDSESLFFSALRLCRRDSVSFTWCKRSAYSLFIFRLSLKRFLALRLRRVAPLSDDCSMA